MAKRNKNTKRSLIPFTQVLGALVDLNQPFSPVHLHRFSDLTNADLTQVKIIWPKVSVERRAALMEDLEDLADQDSLVSFFALADFGLQDEEPRVRAASLRLLWDSDDPHLSSYDEVRP
jgi:hypothetical protein